MTSSKSKASRNSLAAALAFVAALMVWLLPGVAEAQRKRVVILELDGPKAEKFHEDLVKLVKKKHTVIPADKWASTADDLGAAKLTDGNVKKVAKKLKIDAVITGKIEKRRDEYILQLKVRSGKTGAISGNRVDVTSEGPRIDASAAKDLKDELLGAIESMRDGDDEEEEAEEEERPKKKKKKVEEAEEEEEEEAPKKSKKELAAEAAKQKKDEEAAAKAEKAAAKLARENEEREEKERAKKEELAAKKKKKAEEAEPEEEEEEEKPKKKKKGFGGGSMDEEAAALKTKSNEDEEETENEDEESPRKKSKRAASSEDDEEESVTKSEEDEEEEDNSDVNMLAPGERAIEAMLGMSLNARRLKFTYDAGLMNNPPPYNGVPVAGANIDITAYPLAIGHKNRSILRGLGATVFYDRVLKISSKSRGVELPTKQQRFMIGGVFRYPLGTFATVGGMLRFGKQSFNIDGAQGVPATLPDTVYTLVEPSVFIRIHPSSKFSINLTAGFLGVLSTGEFQDNMAFGAATVSGGEGEASVDYMLTKNIFVRGSFRYAYYGYTFEGSGGALRERDNNPNNPDVAGASDKYVGGTVLAGYLY